MLPLGMLPAAYKRQPAKHRPWVPDGGALLELFHCVPPPLLRTGKEFSAEVARVAAARAR